MRYLDAVVIGGGILGCMTARNLRRWNISTLLLEKEDDICKGITRANSAICYAGYDNKPGSLKAEMTVRGNARMAQLCKELDVAYSQCGSLLVTYDEASVAKLYGKLDNAKKNGVPGVRLLTGEEAEAMEPMLRSGVVAALYAPTTGTVNPWQLGIAAAENAKQNGAEIRTHAEVSRIQKTEEGFLITAGNETVCSKMVFNCAGLSADRIQELTCTSEVHLELDGAEYLVFDVLTEKPSRVIFHQAQSCGKGITAIPCTEGNLLISGIRKPLAEPFATTPEGLKEVSLAAQELLPDLDMGNVIRAFGAVRPNPHRENGESINDFCIENPEPGFYSLIGIKTPGLTCANELGAYLAEKAAAFLAAEENSNFDPYRTGIREKDDEIICLCEGITKAQILEAIRRGAATVEGIKRRVGSGMGRCQGSRCSLRIEKLLEEYANAI